jgi:hypothetical protein
MKGLHALNQTVLYGAAGILLSGSFIVGTLPAIAQATLQLRLPNLSAPGNRESGSTRSTSCIDPTDQLVALMPDTNYGLTQNGYPTFYFYLPPTAAEQVKFVMYNEATNDLFYEGQFRVKGDSGIVSVSLPNNGLQQPLAVDESYVWYLSVVCDVNDPSANVVVEGTIARVAPLAAVEQAIPASLPSLYAAEGLWYDALDASASLKLQDDTTAWNTLLDAVDLNDFITVPLLTESVSGEEQILSPTHQ